MAKKESSVKKESSAKKAAGISKKESSVKKAAGVKKTATVKKTSGGKRASGIKKTAFGIERSGLGGHGVNEGKLPYAFPTKKLANEWLQFVAKLGADFGTYACSYDMQGEMDEVSSFFWTDSDPYSVVKSTFGYAKVDDPDHAKNRYFQEFKLVDDVSGLPVLSCKPSEMTVAQAEVLLGFLFIDENGNEANRMRIYACRLLRCLNAADKGADNNGYELFDPARSYEGKEIVLPKGTTEIGEMECKDLESVVIPEGVVRIGASAFDGCDQLKVVKLPSTLKEIGAGAFSGCLALVELNFPEGIEKIGGFAFSACHQLKTVRFPSTLKEIGEYAFHWCDALVELKLPDGIEKIGESAFDYKWYSDEKVLECSDLSEWGRRSWRELILEHPELGARCTCWDEFDVGEWKDILAVAPQYASKCEKWDALEGMDAFNWSELLAAQPQLSDKCNAWVRFEDDDWDCVVEADAKFEKLREQFGPKQLSGYPADYVRGEAKGLYCVIDVSGGKDAAQFPVSYLDDIPDGGWTDEYKTSRIVLRLVAPMTFSMKKIDYHFWRRSDDIVRQVKLTKPYYIGVFEVTQKQWELVMGRTPSRYDDESDSAMHPVEQVSYRDIRGNEQGLKWPDSACVDEDSFLGILRKKSGIENIDLPTEAEWECAGKAGIGDFTRLSADFVKKIAWESDEKTHAVGKLAANGLGLYDVLGNVSEWCIDRHGKLKKSIVADPVGCSKGSKFVVRNSEPPFGDVYRASAEEEDSELGLRLSITLEKAPKMLLQKASEIKEVSFLGCERNKRRLV